METGTVEGGPSILRQSLKKEKIILDLRTLIDRLSLIQEESDLRIVPTGGSGEKFFDGNHWQKNLAKYATVAMCGIELGSQFPTQRD
jgi:hypothetical protein